MRRNIAMTYAALFVAASHLSASPVRAAEPVTLTDALVIEPVGQYGRWPLYTDALEAALYGGDWVTPSAGDAITLPDEQKTQRLWQTAKAGDDGWLSHDALRGGYALFTVPSPTARIVLLDAAGHGTALVNGAPRAGDPYANGSVLAPIQLRKGDNTLIFHVGRGRLRAALVEPAAPVMFTGRDDTMPDLIVGEATDAWAAVVVANATDRTKSNLRVVVTGDQLATATTPLPPIGTMAVRKVPVRLRGPAPRRSGRIEMTLRLFDAEGDSLALHHERRASARVRAADESQRRTFISEIDGSVQYYALKPMKPETEQKPDAPPPALILTLHGAAVEATGQADAMHQKDWAHIVAPTNRRPFGFDWEDWGRLDAMEVLTLAKARLKTDPLRTYLTGHSMGGHGTWHLGATYPDQWAAIGPSAGWISFFSYAGAMQRAENPLPAQEIFFRCMNPSDTLALKRNFQMHAVWVLHGDKDDNVPVEQAREMKKELEGEHKDFHYHEQPGAGHWWGSDCVDWPPMMQVFRQRTIPPAGTVREIDFVTASPGVSAHCRWLTIEAQIRPLAPSRATITYDPVRQSFEGVTENVARLSIGVDLIDGLRGGEMRVTLDGQSLDALTPGEAARRVWLRRDGEGKWSMNMTAPSPQEKGHRRSGGFKTAFNHRAVLVYGTQGDEAENAWAYAKARYDAETFWYRGNGAFDVVADVDFDASRETDRNVVLYGNADTNAAWAKLLAACPVKVARQSVTLGDRSLSGEHVGGVFVYPRPGSAVAVVGVVTGTTPRGMGVTNRLPYFVSGAGFPDLLFVTDAMRTKGSEAVAATGFFGNDWAVESGDIVYAQ